MKTALSIAGFDPSGGAGILADIKTFSAFNVYGMACISSLTVQNTKGVFSTTNVPRHVFDETLHAIFTDIFPDAIKIGMIPNKDYVYIIEKYLKKYDVKNVVIDPVLISSSGKKLLEKEDYEIFFNTLFKYATLITPNLDEAQIIAKKEVKNELDICEMGKFIEKKYSIPVLIKGGHSIEENEFATDRLFMNEKKFTFSSKKIVSNNTHGTGCTLSSSIASNLALGLPLYESIKKAKNYLFNSIFFAPDLGGGTGPLNHSFNLTYKEEL